MFKKLKSLVNSHWSLVIILIIASFLRLHNFIPLEIRPANNSMVAAARDGLSLTGLTSLPPGLYPDEAMNGNNAVEALETGNFKVFYPENFGREGLFINIQSWFIGLISFISPMVTNQSWILRLPSAIFGILTVLGVYFLTKELFKDGKIALLAAFLMATSFWHINFSRIGFRAIMAPFFLIWASYFLLKFFNLRSCDDLNIGDKFLSSQDRKNWILVALAGITYGLGFYSYIAYRATPPLILFIFYCFYKKQHTNILQYVGMLFLIFTIAAVITIAPLGLHFLENPQDFLGRTAGISIFNSETPIRDLAFNKIKTLGMFNFVGDFNWRHNVAGRPLLFWPVGVMFLIGTYISLKKIFKEKKWVAAESIIWVWFLTAFLPVVISNEGLPHALRSLLMVTPVFILAAIGGLKIYEFLKLKLSSRLLSVVVYVFCSLLLFESYVTYFITWGQNPNVKPAFAYNDYVIAQYLNSLPKDLPKYVVLNEKVSGAIERDNPISLQSILFLTDTFTNEKRKENNIYYISPEDIPKIPKNAKLIYLE